MSISSIFPLVIYMKIHIIFFQLLAKGIQGHVFLLFPAHRTNATIRLTRTSSHTPTQK